jgi:hypothetical protein
MALVLRAGGKVEFTREELARFEKDRRTGAMQLVLKEEGDKLIVFVDDSEKRW